VRLHLNENTAGCSPAVMRALQALGRQDAGFYPDYDAAREAVAGLFDVTAESVLLTNGLDEGILAAIGAAFRDRHGGVPETVGVAPAFDMYEILTTALGGKMVTVPLGPAFDLDIAGPRSIDGKDVPPPGWTPFTYIMNLTGQPAISMPAGWTRSGLPVGLQICGPHLGDEIVLRAAAAYEAVAPWSDRWPPLTFQHIARRSPSNWTT